MEKFTGKKPSDVVQVTFMLRDSLNELRKSKGLKPVPKYVREGGRVTPAVVCAGAVLNGAAELTGRFLTRRYLPYACRHW